MKNKLSILIFIILLSYNDALISQEDSFVRGLCTEAPSKEDVPKFVELIDTKLSTNGLNTLVLRIDYSYEFKKRPELRGNNPLSEADIKKIVSVCKKHNIKLIPQINMLGHQSWEINLGKLLEVYPQFDETPSIQLPKEYKWPNADGLYCKSYCTKHPDVHNVVFDLIDEITEVFESEDFHAGMDEVFYIAHEDCKRCFGEDPSILFANEITKLRNHLNETNKRLWIWGDRLIDGKTTGIGLWEGSYNNTHRAIDFIPKDVVINDWHYEQAHYTPMLFAYKGFDVIACPWNKPDVAVNQVEMMRHLKQNSPSEMKSKFRGIMHTYWGSTKTLIRELNRTNNETDDYAVATFERLCQLWK